MDPTAPRDLLLPGSGDSTEAALAAIASTQVLERGQLLRWLGHEDEAVIIAVITQHPSCTHHHVYESALQARIGHAMLAEPERWTPLLDAYAAAFRWRWDTLAGHQRAWARWARAQRDPGALDEPMTAFSSGFMQWVAAKEFRAWTPDQIRATAQAHPRTMARFGRNRFVTGPAADAVIAEAYGALQTPDGDVRATIAAGEALEGLFDRDWQLPARSIAALVGLMRHERRAIGEAAAAAFGHYRHHTDADLRAGYDAVREDARRLGMFLSAQAVPLAFVAYVLADQPRLKLFVRRALVKRADVLADPGLRAQLAQGSECSIVLRALIDSAPDMHERGQLVERLLRQNPENGIAALESATKDDKVVLSRGTMKTLVTEFPERYRERVLGVIDQVVLDHHRAAQRETPSGAPADSDLADQAPTPVRRPGA